jgi:hypothetical protein
MYILNLLRIMLSERTSTDSCIKVVSGQRYPIEPCLAVGKQPLGMEYYDMKCGVGRGGIII